MTPQALTPRQATALMLIETMGRPSFRELSKALGVRLQAVYDLVTQLRTKGYLADSEPYSGRTLVARLPEVRG